MKPIGVAIYGANGHQIQGLLAKHPKAKLAAMAAFDRSALPEPLKSDAGIVAYQTLDELLADKRVDFVSLCSPRRADQTADALQCLAAGKHVYAEKPCATSERDLDRLLAAAAKGQAQFREMGGAFLQQPFMAMRQIVQSGRLGTVVQVLAQKSYPYHDSRPQDEAVDGGLTCQNGVHALRFVEHVACAPVKSIEAMETTLGNPKGGNLRMASSMIARLENGGVACILANYLNQPGLGTWGNECVRIFGTLGMLETDDGATETRLIIGKQDMGPIDSSEPGLDYFSLYIDSLLGGPPMPMSLEEELHPTRMVLRAKADADAREAGRRL